MDEKVEWGNSMYLDLRVHRSLLAVVLLILVWVHADVVEGKLLLYAVLEQLSLLQGETIRLGNDRHNIDSLAQLLQDDNIDWLEGVTGGGDEVQAAVDAGVLDVTLTLRSQLLAQICAVLVLDVLDNRIPAAVVVHQVAISRGINNVQAQTHAVLLDDVGHGVDLGRLADGLVGGQATLAVDEVRGEDGVDECRLAEAGLSCARTTGSVLRATLDGGLRRLRLWLSACGCHGCARSRITRHTDADNVELEATLEEFLLDLRGDAVETDVALGEHALGLLRDGRHCGSEMRVSGECCGSRGCQEMEMSPGTVWWW